MAYTLIPPTKVGSGNCRTYSGNATVMSISSTSGTASTLSTGNPYTITSTAAFSGIYIGDCIRVNAQIYQVTAIASTSSLTATRIIGTDGSFTSQAFYASSNAFRNVAQGASVVINSTTYTVSTKVNDSVITLGSTVGASSSYPWTYTNPVLTITTIQTMSNKKSSSPMKISFPTMDSDTMMAFDIDGVERQINVNATVVGTDLETVAIPTVESLCDGGQFTTSTIPLFTTDMPPRTYKVYFNTVTWEYSSEFVNAIDITFDVSERGI